MNSKTKILLLLIVLVAFSGCKDQLPAELSGLAGEQSLQRLTVLPADSPLLLSLHSDGVLGKLPNLGPEGRDLGRFGPTKLVLVNREQVADMAKVDGVIELVLWGDDKALSRLDPMLRIEILNGMAAANWREKQYPVIGTFDQDVVNLGPSITDAGAAVGSVTGSIVTFEATCEVIFDILLRDDLSQLNKPALQQSLQGLN